MQVEHKCYIKERNKGKGASKMVQKWQGKALNNDAGTSKQGLIPEPVDKYNVFVEEKVTWNQVLFKSTAKSLRL